MGRILGIINWDHGVSNINRLHADVFYLIKFKSILWILVDWPIFFLNSWILSCLFLKLNRFICDWTLILRPKVTKFYMHLISPPNKPNLTWANIFGLPLILIALGVFKKHSTITTQIEHSIMICGSKGFRLCILICQPYFESIELYIKLDCHWIN